MVKNGYSEEEIRKLKRAKADPIIAPDKGQVLGKYLWKVLLWLRSQGVNTSMRSVLLPLHPWGEYEKILTGFTGRVVEICAKQGDTVNKGDVIAYIKEVISLRDQ